MERVCFFLPTVKLRRKKSRKNKIRSDREELPLITKSIKRGVVALVSTCLLFAMTLSASASGLAAGRISVQTDELPEAAQKLTDGVYNIINKATGDYITAYDLKYDADGSAVLNPSNESDSQSFLIKLRDDGNYAFYPQNDGGEYALCYARDIIEKQVLGKTNQTTPYIEFHLTEVSDNGYLISPAFTVDSDLVLGVSSITTYLGHHYVGMQVYNGEETQKWEFVRVGSRSLDISTDFLTVKTEGSAKLYGITQPSYLASGIVWTSDNPEIAAVDSDGTVRGVSAGQTIIRATLGDMTVASTVSVTDLPAFAWFSQHNVKGGGWYASAVSGLYLRSASGIRKVFFVDGYNGTADWMDEGCKISCIAMVLRNMNAKLAKGYDLRTNQTDNLDADPFTVMLANAGSNGKELTTRRLSGSPIVAAYSNISSRFTVNGKAVESSISGVNRGTIKHLLDEHPEGVIVGFKNYARGTSHYLVFTECVNPEETNPNRYEFRVCDPVASDPAEGNNVLFTESYSYKKIGYRYSHMVDVQVYNVVE